MQELKPRLHAINVNVSVDDEYIDDVVCAALEGGITYWCKSATPANDDYRGGEWASDVISRGGELLIDPGEGDPVETLTLSKFMEGLRIAVERYGFDVLDADNVDADIADSIVQYGLYGEIRYC